MLVVRGYEDAKEKEQENNIELIREKLNEKLLQGFSKKEAARMVADELKLPKNKVYKIMVESSDAIKKE